MDDKLSKHEDYKMGWICALHLELSAAMLMLDKRTLPQDRDDDESYVLGRIGEHNVVIAALPEGEIRTNSASCCLANETQFQSDQVWINGGHWEAACLVQNMTFDSVRSSSVNRVLQYDLGKKGPSGFINTGFLDSPPVVLRSAMGTLRAEHRVHGGNRLSEYFSPTRNPRLPLEFCYPSGAHDELFKAEYNRRFGLGEIESEASESSNDVE